MSCNDKCGFRACSCIGVLISIVFGALIGVLFAFDYITFISTIVWIVFGLGVLNLLFLIIGVYLAAVTFPDLLKRCCCANAICWLAGIIGTIIAAIVALSIVLDTALLAVIIVIAIMAFFFALMLIGLIAIVQCIVCNLCGRQ